MVTDGAARVQEIQVKRPDATSHWIWGVIRLTGSIFHQLYQLWLKPERRDEYFGTLINAWIAEGGEAFGIPCGAEYVDVGTLNGYRRALKLLNLDASPTQEKETAMCTAAERLPHGPISTAA